MELFPPLLLEGERAFCVSVFVDLSQAVVLRLDRSIFTLGGRLYCVYGCDENFLLFSFLLRSLRFSLVLIEGVGKGACLF